MSYLRSLLANSGLGGRARMAVVLLTLGGWMLTAMEATAGLKVYYIRHGESGANVSKDYADKAKEDRPAFVGNADTFSPLGETQVAAVAAKLAPYHFDLIAVSPLWRTRHTILPYLTERKLKGEIWPELAEFSQSHGGLKLLGAPGLPAPGGDLLAGNPIVLPEAERPFFVLDEANAREIKISVADAQSNAADLTKLQEIVVERIKKRYGGTDASILLVGHSNAGRALLGVLTGDLKAGATHIENTGLWMAEEQADGTFKVKILNDQPYEGAGDEGAKAEAKTVPKAADAVAEASPAALVAPLVPPTGGGGLEAAPVEGFSIVVIPDTQEYLGKGTKLEPKSGDPVTNPTFDIETKWVVNHLADQRVAFVCHTGDIVDKPKVDAQWELAQEYMSRFDGKVPYAICVGNHDMTKEGESLQFQKYFPASHFATYSWYGGSYGGDAAQPGHSGNNANSYQLFSANGRDFVMLALECNAPDGVVEWANGILDKYKDRTAFIATHMDLGLRDGGPETQKAAIKSHTAAIGRMTWTKCHGAAGNSGVALWEKLYRKHANLLAVFSADQGGVTSAYQADVGDHGNTVHCFMSDYSTAAVRIYRFLPKENQIRVITYDTEGEALVQTAKYAPEAGKHQFAVEWKAGPEKANQGLAN